MIKIKIQFCSGGNQLPGWINHDTDCDIRHALPYPDNHADYIFCEHGIEHVEIDEAVMFLDECLRILKPEGVARIAIPDIVRIWSGFTPAYGAAVKQGGHGEDTKSDAVLSAVLNHGHRAAWTGEMLCVLMGAVGFRNVTLQEIGESDYGNLRNIEGHWKVVGADVARVETSVAEGIKI